METKTTEAFIKFVESFSPPRNRRRVITAFYVSLADQHESEMLEYATTHEAELVGIFEGDHIQRIARTAEAMAA